MSDPAAAVEPVSYRLLGPLEARLPGQTDALELGAPKQRVVLALLLLNRGRVVPVDRLVDAVWGEDAPGSALAGLQAYVSNLRRLLRRDGTAASPIVRRAGGYVMDVAAGALDTGRFVAGAEAARAALEAQRWEDTIAAAEDALGWWRGDLLQEFGGERWLHGEGQGLDELRTECREALVTALLATRRVPAALVAVQALRAAHPLRDRACWLHMIALHQSGRSTEALDEYRRHAAALDEELGLEPGTELRELQVAILRHDASLAAWPRAAGWDGAARLDAPQPVPVAMATEPADALPSRETLVGRARELAVLDAALAEARAAAVRWVLLTGTAGIGKTRLTEELGRRVRAVGGREAWARCSEEDGAPAWWPIRQIVRALGEDPDAVLVAPSGDTDDVRFALYERVAALVTAAAENGLLLVVVDDVQWADKTSAGCLAHLVAALRDLPVLFAATLRDQEDTTAIGQLLAALPRHDGYRQLPVGPLAAEEVGELAAHVSGQELAASGAEELAARTGGNPLFVCEYARLPTEERAGGEVPVAVRTVLGRRLAGLDDELLQVLRAAAVTGETIDMATLTAMTGRDPDALADLLDAAADEHILAPAPDSGTYAFAHGLLRQEILAGIPAMRRQRLHARAAAALDGFDDDDRVSRRARHVVAAVPSVPASEAVVACRAAAALAEHRWSAESAAEWWAEAVRVFDLQPADARDPDARDELVVALVFALARAGRGQSIFDVLDAALLDAARERRFVTIGRMAAALERCAGSWPLTAYAGYGDDPGPVIERLEGLRHMVAGEPVAAVPVLGALSAGRAFDPDESIPEALSREALALAERQDDPSVLADGIVGRLLTYSGVAGHYEEAIALAARLEQLAADGSRERRVDAAIGMSVASLAQMGLGRVAESEATLHAAITASETLGLSVLRVQLRWMQGAMAGWRGDFAQARRHLEIADRFRVQSELSYRGTAVFAFGMLDREEGNLAAMDREGNPHPVAWDAAIAASTGDATTAAQLIGRWLEDPGPWTWWSLGHLALVADACADAADREHAPRLLELLEPYHGNIGLIGHNGVVAPVSYVAGRLHGLLGHVETARALLADARALAESTGARPTVARCGAALAAL